MGRMASGKLHPLKVITYRFPLDEIGGAADKATLGAIKVLVTP